jgi:glycosyltransferase involved in cell wall biosynthesis
MITIITPVYNSEKTLEETLESVFKQKEVLIEHIIVNGESTDNSHKIIETFIKNHQNQHISYVYISEKDYGMYDAINKGLKISNGDIIGILNSDDTFSNPQVVKTLEIAMNDSKSDAVYGNVDVINENKNVIRKIRTGKFQLGDYQRSKHPAHPTFYVKKEIVDTYGYYDLRYSIASDGEYMFRLLEIHQIKHHYIDEVLVIMKDGGLSQNGFKSTLKIIKETKDFMKKHQVKFSVLKYIFSKFKKINEYKKG